MVQRLFTDNLSQGVAYSWGPEWPRPHTLQHWPGKLVHELDNKVPTQIAYDRAGSIKPTAWGFLIDIDDDALDHKEFFKLHLDPRYANANPNRDPTHEVKRRFRDYMRCVYRHIAETISNAFVRWESKRVEFLFSVPTTWKDR